MTIKLTGNTLGGVIEANGISAANITSASGLPFCKNKLFNGEVTRINQRGFDGNWATKNNWNSGNTIAQQELCYSYDMWAKCDAPNSDGQAGTSNMCQLIEAGNFRPSTVHTLSGTGVITTQITSPASGNWRIVVPNTARNVQVEEGSVATPFEIRPISFELAQCQRYYLAAGTYSYFGLATGVGSPVEIPFLFPVAMRTVPYFTWIWLDGDSSVNTATNLRYTYESTRGGALAFKSQVAAIGTALWVNFRPFFSAVI